MRIESAIFGLGAAGVPSPCSAEFRCSGRDIGSSRSAEDGWTSGAAGALTQVKYSTFPSENYPFRHVKNYRQHPEYKSAASGLRFPFTPRTLSGWYVPSPDLVSSRACLNGRNAEYSGHFGLYASRPAPEPDREEKGLSLTEWKIYGLRIYD